MHSTAEESRLEDYLVRDLLLLDDVDYDTHADLLYKLAGQLVAHLRSYLPDDADVRNVLLYYAKTLLRLVHTQLEKHHFEHGVTYEMKVVEGVTKLQAQTFSAPVGQPARAYGQPVADRSTIRRIVFNGFTKCLYELQKFDSDPERRFAIVLEHDESVLKWIKPAREAFEIYLRDGRRYEPDFVAETKSDRWICEVKQADMVDDPEVVEKARAAVTWCQAATKHTAKTDKKPWRYMLVPDTAVAGNMTIAGLAAKYERRA
jgi:type III restriction enzyme